MGRRQASALERVGVRVRMPLGSHPEGTCQGRTFQAERTRQVQKPLEKDLAISTGRSGEQLEKEQGWGRLAAEMGGQMLEAAEYKRNRHKLQCETCLYEKCSTTVFKHFDQHLSSFMPNT